MDITSFAAPPPGSAQPGNLYADLQSRTLWLGVNTAVDPAGAVLISDMLKQSEDLAEATTNLTAYVDAQILTCAPSVHQHTAAQITDFAAAVQAVVATMPGAGINSKLIAMYHGSVADIGVGAWAGWQLCDGSNGTPDLRDKFVIGAGNKVPGPNTPVPLQTDVKGAHVHTNAGFALTGAHMPPHSHSVSGSFSGSGGAYTDTHGGHQHPIGLANTNVPDEGGWSYKAAGSDGSAYSGLGGSHNHYVSMAVSGSISGTAASMGGGQAHTHTMDTQGDHKHGFATNALREAIAYYALAFVMKL